VNVIGLRLSGHVLITVNVCVRYCCLKAQRARTRLLITVNVASWMPLPVPHDPPSIWRDKDDRVDWLQWMLSQAGQQVRLKHAFPFTDYSECAAAIRLWISDNGHITDYSEHWRKGVHSLLTTVNAAGIDVVVYWLQWILYLHQSMRWQIAASKAALNMTLHGARRDATQSSCRRCSPAHNRKPLNSHRVQLLPFSLAGSTPSHRALQAVSEGRM